MRYISVFLLILIAVLAINAAPSKKVIRVPFRLAHADPAAVLKRRSVGKLPLRSLADIAFVGKIDLGTPPQTFEVMIDTGSSYLGVADAFCKNCGGNPPKIPLYNGGNSVTFQDLGEEYWSIFKDDSYIYGTWTLDQSNLGGVHQTMAFGRATEMPDAWVALGFSGVLGLRLPSSHPLFQYPTVIETLSEMTLDDSIIGCHFVKDNPDQAGEIIIGGYDPQVIDGDIQRAKILPNNEGDPDWIIAIADLQIEGKSIAKDGTAFIDTGSSSVFMSAPAVEAIYADTGAKRMDDGVWAVPDPFPHDVVFFIGNGQFMIPKGDVPLKQLPKYGDLYHSAIQTGEVGGSWLLGIPFIKNQYVFYDFGRLEIGIAKTKAPSASSSTSSKAAMPSDN